MSEVKGRRRYDASGRQEQARRTRAAVLDAARTSFLDIGYARTTMAAIAKDAGVSVETVYKAFGNKAGVVKALFDVSVVGDDEPIPLVQRDFVKRNQAEPDPRKKLMDFAEHIAEVSQRAAPVQLVVRDAAATDPAAAEVWAQLGRERLAGMTMFAANLEEGGHLRADVTPEEARDVLASFISVELWDLLVNQRGWDPDRFADFFGRQLIAALL